LQVGKVAGEKRRLVHLPDLTLWRFYVRYVEFRSLKGTKTSP
jgi:hypothetical protein